MNGQTETTGIADLMAASGVAFGTSGARGLASAMTDRVCYLYTLGFLQYLEQRGQIRPGNAVALAADHRPSSPRILAAAVAAIRARGYRPVHCGNIPSPALACHAIDRGIASLMITGSHIPDDRNGIKFNLPQGEVLKRDEAGIRSQLVEDPADRFTDGGMFRDPVEVPGPDPLAYRQYLARYLDAFPAGCLAGSRVLVYEHSSVAAGALAEIFSGLDAVVTRRGHSDTFVPVDTEAVRPEDVALAKKWAAAGDFDLLVSADGDGDRPLVGDEQGNWLRGDVVGILTARFLGAGTVVTPVSSNTALEKSGWFTRTRRTRIGSPYVIEAMQQALQAGEGPVVGYEANGGFLTMSATQTGGRRMLGPLPTRDAVIVPLAVLLLARHHALPVSRLGTLLPPRFTASDRVRDFPTGLSRRLLDRLAADESAIFEQFPMLGAVDQIDLTDGLRVTFASGEVLHLRPSGNAPELRCYTEADSAERARALNARCLELMETWRE